MRRYPKIIYNHLSKDSLVTEISGLQSGKPSSEKYLMKKKSKTFSSISQNAGTQIKLNCIQKSDTIVGQFKMKTITKKTILISIKLCSV
jgi:hypothetical protein